MKSEMRRCTYCRPLYMGACSGCMLVLVSAVTREACWLSLEVPGRVSSSPQRSAPYLYECRVHAICQTAGLLFFHFHPSFRIHPQFRCATPRFAGVLNEPASGPVVVFAAPATFLGACRRFGHKIPWPEQQRRLLPVRWRQLES